MAAVGATLSFSIINILGVERVGSAGLSHARATTTTTTNNSCSTSSSSCMSSGCSSGEGRREVDSSDCLSCDDLDSRGESELDVGGKDEGVIDEEEVGRELYLVENQSQGMTKRQGRMRFTPAQIQVLEKRFLEQHYLLPADRKFLARSLHMTERQVKTWFQNKRAQYKRTRPLVRNPVYHHPGPLSSPLLALPVPRLHLLQTGPFGIDAIHLPATPTGPLRCHPTLLASSPIPTFPPPHLPMPMAYIPVPVTPSK